MGKTIVHGLKLLRNVWPIIAGYVMALYFFAQYSGGLAACGADPMCLGNPALNIPFWYMGPSVLFGFLGFFAWIFLLAKLGVE